MVNTNKYNTTHLVPYIYEKYRPKSMPENYQMLIDAYVAMADAMVRSSNFGLYIVDVCRGACIYASDNIENFCGVKPEDMFDSWWIALEKNIPKKGLQTIQEARLATCEFFNKLSAEDKLKYTCLQGFAFCYKKHSQVRIFRSTPLALSSDDKIWLVLCIVSLSNKGKVGEVIIRNTGNNDEEYVYCRESKVWKKRPQITISQLDRDILRQSLSGYSVKEIAEQLCLSPETIKAHKKNMFEEFGVSSITEALAFADNHKLL